MNKNERLSYLLTAYVSGTITAPEHDELFALIATGEYDDQLKAAIDKDLQTSSTSSPELPAHVAEGMIRHIFQSEKNTSRVLPLKPKPYRLLKWAAVAASVLLIAASLYFFNDRNHSKQQVLAETPVPANATAAGQSAEDVRVIQLPDGTRVTLQPNSRLHTTASFGKASREVWLEGEAFFQVAKDTRRPFLVYYRNIVTRVLGTSFSVNTNEATGNVEVAVRTGRVQVFEQNHSGNSAATNGVVLVPNQKAVYKTAAHLFETALADEPQPLVADSLLTGESPSPAFVYEQDRLQEVFADIQQKYGIEIVLTSPALNNCVFTGDVSSQDLFTKLKIICLTTRSEYEINGTRILIRGEGCH